MSTDDSISEDVSSSVGALSHCHVGPNGDGGKESETSLVSSEGTSASGLAGPEDGHIPTSRTPVDALDIRPLDITPACNKIRSLCLSTDEAFEQGKNLPFINPSPLETLRVLVQEIQSSGETDPEIWKDCEGRWLHLFQLVEKQYQEQILAQQEQYQCQIQLIQDEIKALVQLQNRQGSGQPTPVNATLIPSDPSPPEDLTAARYPLTSPSPPPPDIASETSNSAVPSTEELLATVRSSGYGTLSVWESGLGQPLSPGDVHEASPRKRKHSKWTCGLQDELPEVTGTIPQQSFSNETTPGTGESCPLSSQQRDSRANQPLTSWAQRQKLRLKKGRAGQTSPQVCDYYQESLSPREPHRHTVALDQHQLTGLSSNEFPLRRSDSLLSEVSGLTYWRLNENEIYRPLPDSFDSGAYLLLQEVSMSLTPPQEPRLSLRQIYENKQKPEPKHTDWDGSGTSSPLSPQQALTLDPAVHMRQSERTSGVTSPSNVSSPSFPAQAAHHLYPKHGTPGTPVSPDSVVECSANNPGDTDCSSNMSSFSPTKVQSPWAHPSQQSTSRDKDQTPCSFPARVSEEEGSLTSTLKLKSTSGASQHAERSSLLGDPVALSLLRQNLREKHYRHVDDLRAYYESEIQTLREKLNLRDLPQDLEKSNQALRERCEHLERALAEAASHIQELEGKNVTLEKKLVEWPERYAVAVATVKSLQQRLEESKRFGAEREASAARLESRVRQLEEAAQAACREARDKEVRREREYKMLQDLLGEYDSLKKVHGGVKNSLVSAEDKHHRANDQISELKRVISKLESQVKQLEHENQARSRHHAPHNSTQPSGAGLFHHPDLLPSPSKHQTEADPVSGLRSPRRLTDQSESGRRSPFAQTNQSNGYRRSPYLQCDQSAGSGGLVDSSGGGSNRRCSSPPDKLQSHPQEHGGGGCGLREAGRRDRSSNQTPMLKALIELEETRSTQSRAPWVGSQRTTVGLVERKHKEPIQEQAAVGADAYVDELVRGSAGPEQGADRTVRCRHDGPERPQRSLSPERASAAHLKPQRSLSPERASAAHLKPQRSLSPERASAQAALLRPQRSLSPEGHRSSSLPPHHHSLPPATPTKRETLLMPLSARSSPKRCPTENYSTALGQLPRQQHLQKRLDVPLDQRRHSFHSASPRKRLHFTASRRDEDLLQSCSLSADFSGSVNPTDTNSQLGWVEQGAAHQGVVLASGRELLDSCEELLLPARLHSLADAERLLDELTQEKLQIEAALSRIPGAGSRVSLQNRLDEVALENRLERVNRELGSIRMTLKRFHVLRSSANV